MLWYWLARPTYQLSSQAHRDIYSQAYDELVWLRWPPVLSIFLINLPVEGEPLEFSAYFKGTFTAHLLGLLAGTMWCTGILIPMVVGAADPAVQVPRAITFPLAFAMPLVSALWGFGVLKEFPPKRGRVAAVLLLLLLAASVAVVALAPPTVKAV